MSNTAEIIEPRGGKREVLESVVVRFAGDSGDGMQLTGSQFTHSTALTGNDLATFPDFPAEIRAPAGTTFGVSAFQINFGGREILTAGDQPDVLVAMNPAALKVNLDGLRDGGLVIVDAGTFKDRDLRKAGYDSNPLEDGSLDGYEVIEIDVSRLVLEAVKEFGLGNKDGLRCKNMWLLGLIYWLYGRDRQPSIDWLEDKFKSKPETAAANIAALNAGHAYGETVELPGEILGYQVPQAKIEPGRYRNVAGAEALAWGLVAGAQLAELPMFFGSYPITPASSLLHTLSRLKQFGITTFQAEDEIAAVCSAIGASYAGQLGITSSSGPGIALKTEAIGLAIMVELPLVVVNSQRAGPSTGMPTKTEQSDLYQAVYGRNADSPLVVVAAHGPGDCFDAAIEACRLAVKFMTPVMLLTDGYIANAAEPWQIPDFSTYEKFPVKFHEKAEGFSPYLRDKETLARAWAVPGTPELMHRIGGIEKDYDSGHISYDAMNHQRMTDVRHDKIARVADFIPEQALEQGEADDDLVIVGWGSTFGAISRAVSNMREQGYKVAHAHLRHIWPLPRNLGDLLRGFDKVICPELNTGQLSTVLRAEYVLDVEPLTKVQGQPFKIREIEAAIRRALDGEGA
ncbi:MAG: 2-oxoglutarate ferredoxin oxidoreductase subunit alpha [Rhizobiales bacterium NRL2]|jgi:2-oxoglutarate ferredoxin oxidoreductase subunit alpha|nr:MAG: 2-oxoglutarate ferredoxin oxidoreductase subunit alpha [Rhizobiales bacterium NRL2]